MFLKSKEHESLKKKHLKLPLVNCSGKKLHVSRPAVGEFRINSLMAGDVGGSLPALGCCWCLSSCAGEAVMGLPDRPITELGRGLPPPPLERMASTSRDEALSAAVAAAAY